MMQNVMIDQGGAVPVLCSHPDCDAIVHRGVVHLCGMDPAGGEHGCCALHFCGAHLQGPGQTCERCAAGEPPFPAKDTAPDWTHWRLTHPSWAEWRAANPDKVAELVEIKRAQAAQEAGQ